MDSERMAKNEAGTAKSREELFREAGSGEFGLDSAEARRRLSLYGYNQIAFHRSKSPILMFLSEFTAMFPLLLLSAALLAFLANMLSPAGGYDLIGYALLGVVVLNAVVSFLQNFKVEKLMISFLDYIPKMVALLRDGRKVMLDAKEVVPGDILFIQEGDKISADGILVEANQLIVDESVLTGESQSVQKLPLGICEEESCHAFSGSTVMKGNGRILVVKTGRLTSIGAISMLSQRVQQDLTPMQKELRDFVRKITWLALGIGTVFFAIGFLTGHTIWTNLVFAIGIIVANVPEGLLPTLTLALSQSSMRMSRRNAIIKDILSVETLGSTTVICTDKTGTLTENRLHTEFFYCDFAEIAALDHASYLDNPASHRLTEIMGLCNDVIALQDERGGLSFKGDPTEVAMVEFVEREGGYKALRSRFEPVTSRPFDVLTKSMTSTYRTRGGALYMTVKGAPEVVVEKCRDVYCEGLVRPMRPEERQKLLSQAGLYASDGLRVLALAWQVVSEAETDALDLTFAGLVALSDPPRPEVPKAVEACKKAGIRIIVMSGDKSETVSYLVRKLGIAKQPFVVEGQELNGMSQSQLVGTLKNEEVAFARIAPEQKLDVVEALKAMGEVVAVTGDGVNDAPALKRADIGISMGLRGTDVARDASDIILLDDNFATIVHAVEEGRGVYENIRKFIIYVLTSNVPEIIPYIAYVLLPIPLPITVVQMLCIDLFTDMLPAIGLGNEPPEPDTMLRPPRARGESLVSLDTFLNSYAFLGPVETVVSFTVFFNVLYHGGWRWGAALPSDSALYREATGAFLAAIIFSQIGNVLACRTSRRSAISYLSRFNPWITGGIIVEIVFIFSVIYLPLFKHFFTTAPLEAWVWSWILPAPFIVFGAGELRKLLVRRGRDGRYTRDQLTEMPLP